MLLNFFLASEAANFNPPPKIAFPDPVTSSVHESSKYFSLKIHQTDLAAPTHQTFCLICGIQRDLLFPFPVEKTWTGVGRDGGEGGGETSAMNDEVAAAEDRGERG